MTGRAGNWFANHPAQCFVFVGGVAIVLLCLEMITPNVASAMIIIPGLRALRKLN